jgi:hypothetical protein
MTETILRMACKDICGKMANENKWPDGVAPDSFHKIAADCQLDKSAGNWEVLVMAIVARCAIQFIASELKNFVRI